VANLTNKSSFFLNFIKPGCKLRVFQNAGLCRPYSRKSPLVETSLGMTEVVRAKMGGEIKKRYASEKTCRVNA